MTIDERKATLTCDHVGCSASVEVSTGEYSEDVDMPTGWVRVYGVEVATAAGTYKQHGQTYRGAKPVLEGHFCSLDHAADEFASVADRERSKVASE